MFDDCTSWAGNGGRRALRLDGRTLWETCRSAAGRRV
jgi:hypothetical protein